MRLPRLPLAVLLLALLGVHAPGTAQAEESVRRSAVVKVVERARNAVVLIRTPRLRQRPDWYPFMYPRSQTETSLGSGSIFHPGGYVITNAHVIAEAEKILVDVPQGDGKAVTEYEAVALAVDLPNDLAILRMLPRKGEENRRFAHLELGRSHDIMLGETCITLGHPLRLGFTVTRGIVSGLDRTLKMKGGFKFSDFIQVDAAVNLGNSGGPLFDITGRWIGVNTAILRRGDSSTAEGIGFAIPTDRVRSLIAKAFKRRMVTGNWFGIDFVEGPSGEARLFRVYPKGPARESGLRAGDVVSGVNGAATPTLFNLRMKMATLPLGARIRLDVVREGKRLSAPIELVDETVPTRRLSWSHLGFEVDDAEVNGVLLTKVREDSPAAQIQLRAGDLIEALGEWRINNSDDLLRFLQVVAPDDTFEVHIKRLEEVAGRVRLARMRGTMKAQ